MSKFRIGTSPDFKAEGHGLLDPILSEYFDPLPNIEYEFMNELTPAIAPEQLRGFDAVITLGAIFNAESFHDNDRLAVIARWGVGYDMIDVEACTDKDILLCITPVAVRKPVAEGILMLLLALTKHLLIKDRVVREGRWDERGHYPGVGLAGRILDSIDLGNIASELFRMVQPLVDDHPLWEWLDAYGPGLHHFCLAVKDIDLFLKEALSKDISPSEPVPHQGTQGKRALFLERSVTGGIQVEVTGI